MDNGESGMTSQIQTKQKMFPSGSGNGVATRGARTSVDPMFQIRVSQIIGAFCCFFHLREGNGKVEIIGDPEKL